MIQSVLINKFRGDAALFVDGMQAIERFTGWPCLGLIPHHPALSHLPQEDSLALGRQASFDGGMTIAVLAYPHIANFDDLGPLAQEPNVRLIWCRPGEPLPPDSRLVILPGSKSTIADLAFVKEQGWDIDLKAHHRRDGRILGICGGFQMLGTRLSDPDGIEGPPARVEGLGLLNISTVFTAHKTVTPWQGRYGDCAVSGYEIHCGVSQGVDMQWPFFAAEGATSTDGRIFGTYIHGLFTSDAFRREFLAQLGAPPSSYHYEAHMRQILDGWADALEAALPIETLLSLARPIAA